MSLHFFKNIMAVLVLLGDSCVYAGEVPAPENLQKIYNSLHSSSPQDGTNAEKIAFYANFFANKNSPYVEEPLGEGEQGKYSQAPLYRFDAFDCTSFVETVMALAKSNSANHFLRSLKQVRYREGHVAFQNRNHFSSLDWIPNNIKNGNLKDITGEIAGKKLKWSQTWIDKKNWFRKKGPEFKEMSEHFKISLGQIPYVAKEDLVNLPYLVERIPSGSIFHIVRPNWDLRKVIGTQIDVSHMGVLVREHGVLYMIHASNGVSRDGSDDIRKVKKEVFRDYLERVVLPSPSTAGINILALAEGGSAAATEEELPAPVPPPTPVPAPKEHEGLPMEVANIPAADLKGPGILKPTVYYFPMINEDKNPCSDESKTALHGEGGKTLARVCSKSAKSCAMEGSCGIIQKGNVQKFNIIGRFMGQERFFKLEGKCKFGFGVQDICLDPYFTVAADLTIYKPGEVIFLPAAVGLPLPGGIKHHGFFVVRDAGRGISGTGRFDFYSGDFDLEDAENPMMKLRLHKVTTNLPYYRISGNTAKMILKDRNFPRFPSQGP